MKGPGGANGPQSALVARLAALEARMDQQSDPLVILPQSKLSMAGWAIAAAAAAIGFIMAAAIFEGKR